MNDEHTHDAADPTTPDAAGVAGTPTSGNRWEPGDPAGAEPVAQGAAAQEQGTAAQEPARSRFAGPRAGVAAVAVTGLLVAGVGGFTAGRLTGGDGEPGIQQVGFQPGDDDRDPGGRPDERQLEDGFHGGLPGGGPGDLEDHDDVDEGADAGSDT